MVIYRNRYNGSVPPCLSLYGIELIKDCKLLGLYIDNRLTFDKHIAIVLSLCSQRFYLLKLLKNQGMSLSCLSNVFASIVVGKLTYCMSVWGGFLKESHVNQINSVFRKGKRYGYTETMYDIKGLLYHFDSTLFNQIRANEEHCLNHILPLIQNGDKILRSRGHGYPLPICLVGSFRESFIPRCLYSFL